ncbi:MAG: hypothetical protein M3O15_05485 [Acidobacteriota bacterium]|nr:hypothetical protein [Acidobacteriota bacterium]
MCPTVPTLVKVLRALDCSAEEFGLVHRPGRPGAGPAVGAGGALPEVPVRLGLAGGVG